MRERVHAQGCSCPLCNTSTYRIKPRTAAGAAGSPGGSWAAAVLRDPAGQNLGGLSPGRRRALFAFFFPFHCNIKAYFFQASFSDFTISFSKRPAGRWPGRRWGWEAVSFAQVFFPKRGVAAAALLHQPPSAAWAHIGPAAGMEWSREGHGVAPPVSICPGLQKDCQSVLPQSLQAVSTDLGAGRERQGPERESHDHGHTVCRGWLRDRLLLGAELPNISGSSRDREGFPAEGSGIAAVTGVTHLLGAIPVLLLPERGGQARRNPTKRELDVWWAMSPAMPHATSPCPSVLPAHIHPACFPGSSF